MFISFLGLGQCGGNIVDEAAKRDFYSAAINFSQQDLDSLENISKKLKLVGSDGIGKQRDDAIKLMNNNWDLATNFVKENFSHSSIEIIFVPFATGGGSGSGIAPVLLSLLKQEMPEKVFVAMPIIPDKKESYINQKNCLDTFEDLSQLDICVLPIDNNKGTSTLNNFGKHNLYKKVNKNVVDLIEQLVSYTDKHSKYGVLDKKDLKAIFNTKGIATISETNLSVMSEKFELSEVGIANKIKESWIRTTFADVELNQILSSGFVFDGQEKLMEYINMEKIFSGFTNKMPISLFEGMYVNDDGKTLGKVITVLSGLSWCNSRLKEIDELLDNTTEMFNKIDQASFYTSKTKRILSNTSEVKKEKVKDISSLISKFRR